MTREEVVEAHNLICTQKYLTDTLHNRNELKFYQKPVGSVTDYQVSFAAADEQIRSILKLRIVEIQTRLEQLGVADE